MDNTSGIVKFYLVKDFTWKFMVLKNSLIYQYVSESMPINLPVLIGYHSLYINGRLFKNALYAQLGADLYYSSSYYADAYMPASGRFYNQFEKKLGSYPYVDLFLNFMVSSARIFLKVSHLNSGLSGNSYYTVPHYPMPDRAYKLGISWMFYD